MANWVLRFSAHDGPRRRHLVAALVRLVRARAEHSRLSAPEILARLRAPPPDPPPAAAGPAPDLDLMRWALAAVGRRLPWRSDCLIQSLAAKRWLNAHGVASDLNIGARKGPDGAITAHAWLTVDGRIVTGGEIGPGMAKLATPPRDGA